MISTQSVSRSLCIWWCCLLFCYGYALGAQWIGVIYSSIHWNNRIMATQGVTLCGHYTVFPVAMKYLWIIHDDVIKWKRFPRYWPFVRGIHRSAGNSPHKGQWRGALMFLWSAPWINGWVNTREAGDLRRNRAHYDVIVMQMYNSPTQNHKTPNKSRTVHLIFGMHYIICQCTYNNNRAHDEAMQRVNENVFCITSPLR